VREKCELALLVGLLLNLFAARSATETEIICLTVVRSWVVEG
jgi:hypothetical protein